MPKPLTALPFDEPTALRVFALLDKRYFDEAQGMWTDEHPYGTCTYVNALPIASLEKAGHKCAMFGKSEEAFAGQPWETEYEAMSGHDWLVVDERWIVDFWIQPYINVPRAVFDLQKPEDRKQVDHIYGPQREWEQAEVAHVNQRQFHPELFDEVLKELRPAPAFDAETVSMHRLPCPADLTQVAERTKHSEEPSLA